MVVVLDAKAKYYPLIHSDSAFNRVLGQSLEKIIEEERRLFHVAMTRAEEKLVIFTDGRETSPFLEDLTDAISLPKIDWKKFPPPKTGEVVMKVGNRYSHDRSPTYQVKDLLRQNGFKWDPSARLWVRAFGSREDALDGLHSLCLGGLLGGLEVKIRDEADELLENYVLEGGDWRCIPHVFR